MPIALLDDRVPVRIAGDSVEDIYPTAAAPLTLTAPGGIANFTAWTAVGTLPAAEEGVVSHVVAALEAAGGLGGGSIEFRYGGATTFETIMAPLPATDPAADDAGSVNISQQLLPTRLPANTAIEARYAQAAVRDVELYLAVWPGHEAVTAVLARSLRQFLGGALVGPPTWTPALTSAAGTGIAAGTPAWTYGAWGNLVAGAAACLVTAIAVNITTTNALQFNQFEVGVNSVACYRSAVIRGNLVRGGAIWPPIYVPQGANITLRHAGSTAGDTGSWYVKTHPLT